MCAGSDVHDVGALTGSEAIQFGLGVFCLDFLPCKYAVFPYADVSFADFQQEAIACVGLEFDKADFVLLGDAAIEGSGALVHGAVGSDVAVLGLE